MVMMMTSMLIRWRWVGMADGARDVRPCRDGWLWVGMRLCGWDALVLVMVVELGRNLGWTRMGAPEFVIVGEREEMEMRV
ncbi:hypothetical protein Tco_1194493 [Tanacetum coccineum]